MLCLCRTQVTPSLALEVWLRVRLGVPSDSPVKLVKPRFGGPQSRGSLDVPLIPRFWETLTWPAKEGVMRAWLRLKFQWTALVTCGPKLCVYPALALKPLVSTGSW